MNERRRTDFLRVVKDASERNEEGPEDKSTITNDTHIHFSRFLHNYVIQLVNDECPIKF